MVALPNVLDFSQIFKILDQVRIRTWFHSKRITFSQVTSFHKFSIWPLSHNIAKLVQIWCQFINYCSICCVLCIL